MKRVVTATLTVALTGGLLVGDVVSLPLQSRAVEPRIQQLALGSGGIVLTSASADVLNRLASATGATEPAVTEPAVTEPAVTEATVTEATVTEPAAAEPVVPEPAAPGSSAPAPAAAEAVVTEPSAAEPGADVLLSPEIETQDFTVAGVKWDAGSSADPSQIQIRVREDDGWTGWETLPVNDEGPDAGTAEYEGASLVTATDPVVSSGADAIQVRVEAPDGDLPDGMEVVVIDPGESAADATLEETAPLTAASAASYQPTIISRKAWGADESLRKCTPTYSSTLQAATVHHTAGSNNYTAAGSAGVVRGIYAYHTKSLGWCDVGYNFLVDKFGRVYEGRAGGVTRPVSGAHAGGFNRNTVGVAGIGNYETAAAPAAMVKAIGEVIGWKLSLHGTNPNGTTTLTSAGGGTAKYAKGRQVKLPVVFGHRDVGSTSCPGKNLYPALTTIRSRAAAAAGEAAFVQALYADMLGRAPAASEVAYWVPYVGAANGRSIVASGFSDSQEYRKKSITAAYVDILGRRPDAAGLQSWYERIVSGRTRIDDIRRQFLASNEFRNQAGGTDAGWVRLMYQRALGRTASSAEVSHWSARLRTYGRERVISEIYDSPESARVRVDRAYRLWLGRTAGSSERSYWMALVLRQGDEAMRQSVMVSQEYYERSARR